MVTSTPGHSIAINVRPLKSMPTSSQTLPASQSLMLADVWDSELNWVAQVCVYRQSLYEVVFSKLTVCRLWNHRFCLPFLPEFKICKAITHSDGGFNLAIIVNIIPDAEVFSRLSEPSSFIATTNGWSLSSSAYSWQKEYRDWVIVNSYRKSFTVL